jgi:hypothetical protein
MRDILYEQPPISLSSGVKYGAFTRLYHNPGRLLKFGSVFINIMITLNVLLLIRALLGFKLHKVYTTGCELPTGVIVLLLLSRSPSAFPPLPE